MFSRILTKLIDQAIVPAMLLIGAKIISTVLVAKYFGIPYEIGPGGFAFTSAKDYITMNSYSTFAMVAALAIGLFYILVKSLIFHETHISPKLTAKLFSLRLSSFMQSSFDLYSQGTVWMSYSYLLLMITGIMGIFGIVETWVFFASAILTVLCTILFVLDIENEIGIRLEKKDDIIEEETILDFGGRNESQN